MSLVRKSLILLDHVFYSETNFQCCIKQPSLAPPIGDRPFDEQKFSFFRSRAIGVIEGCMGQV